MSVSTAASDLSDDPNPGAKPTAFQYDLRLEIGVKEPGGTVPVVAIFRDLVKRMKAVAADGNNPLVVLTATDKLYLEQKDMSSEEFQQAFHVTQADGKATKVLLGFKIRSTTKFSDLKNKLMNSYLKPHHLFLRPHAGGFEHGVKTYAYGYIKHHHPDHPDLQKLNQRFARHLSEAWKNIDKEERKKWRTELPNIFFGQTGIMLPMTFTKERITTEIDGKDRINTHAIVVSVPTKYGKFAKTLLDAVLMQKKINNLIPFALNRENPDGYYYLTAEHARFMETHRNIPIMQVPFDATNKPGKRGQILLDLLHGHPHIQRVAVEDHQGRYHVSTTANKYREVYNWIDELLKDHKFPYEPHLRPLKYNSNTSYGSIFKDAMSAATEKYDSVSIKTVSTNAWRTRPPLDISYVPTDSAFPPLPTKKPSIPSTPSTASETLDEDTIQSAISSAIKKLEDQHKADMLQLKQDFQAKFDAVESQMRAIGKQVATQTYKALTGDNSPLATKLDHEHLNQEISLIQTQLATLVNLLQTGSSVQSNSPSQPASISHTPPPSHDNTPKRSRLHTTPIKMKPLDDLYTQDIPVSSAASYPEVDMEGCEY